jgi:hypothetical protein
MVKLERVLKCRRERETVSACQGQFYQSILRERRTDAHFYHSMRCRNLLLLLITSSHLVSV